MADSEAMRTRKLTDQLRQIAKSELNENAVNVASHLKEIRTWLDDQPHITARTEDQWLLTFLRGGKHKLEKTKAKLDLYYSARSSLPEIFTDRDPLLPEIKKLLELGIMLPLPKVNTKGERIILLNMGHPELSNVKVEHVFQYYTLVIDALILEDDNFNIAGVHAVIDMEGSTMAHFTQYFRHPNLCRKTTHFLLSGTPCRPKGMYYINAPRIFTLFQAFVSPFLTEKLSKRTAAISDSNLQVDDVPIELLPFEYGGTVGSIKDITEEWKKKIESYRSWYAEDRKYGVDESKRKKKSFFFGYF